jgi:protein-arginine kinase activator protein McsA
MNEALIKLIDLVLLATEIESLEHQKNVLVRNQRYEEAAEARDKQDKLRKHEVITIDSLKELRAKLTDVKD